MSDNFKSYDVAVAVVMRAPGVDPGDAADRAEAAVRRALKTSVISESGGLLDDGPRGTRQAMPVLRTMEVGMAARNGYLTVQPTRLAAHDRGLP